MSSSPVAPVLDDDAARARIRGSLGESLLVEASAGTGKTSELVKRIVAVLGAGLTHVSRIVAVTFTNKAAGELKLRLRQGLDRERQDAEGDRARNLEEALARLEEASIGTIHSFCGQILRERPVEARVDPAFEEIAEQENERLYNRAFQQWFQEALEQPSPGLRRALTRMAWPADWQDLSPFDQLKYAGRQLHEWRDFPAEWARPPFNREQEVDRLASVILETAPKLVRAGYTKPVTDLAEWIERAEAVSPRDYDTLEARFCKLWRALKTDKRRAFDSLKGPLEQFDTCSGADLAAELRTEMLALIDRFEWQKRQTGRLDFLDLLLMTRDLVRGNGEVRRYLQNRFSHLFIDEFQDTDPVQAELLLLLAADDPAETDWLNVRPVAGKLFVVGDPKQSIYKFRRADVTLYQQLRKRLLEKDVRLVRLTRSFRAVRPIQLLVNAAFETEMTGDEETGQIEYVPLEEHAPAPKTQPAIVVLPAPHPYGMKIVSKGAINLCLPDAVVGFIDWLLSESRWRVRDPERGDEWTEIAPRHICVLLRRRTNFGTDIAREYTRRLEDRQIPHLLAGSKSLHAREEMENLRVALNAVEWPGDELSVFATLRGAIFAIDDALLLRYRHEHKRLDPFHVPEDAGDYAPIAVALRMLAELHRHRNRQPVADTVNRLLEATRAHAVFALRPGGNQALANLYRLTEIARGYEVQGGISFRGFVEMLKEKAEKGELAEAPVLEEGAEGVRLMTVHAAKGLEFPVVILADLTANIARQEPERFVDAAQRLCAMQLAGCAPYDLLVNKESEHAREAAEGVRIAYVAATRARDLLVVPAVGDKAMDGWLMPLNKAIYPVFGKRRGAKPATGCPDFGLKSVLSRPFDDSDETSVQPGAHRPEAGEHEVVWWDPALLRLGVRLDHGMQMADILAEGDAEGADAYDEWRRRRNSILARGAEPSFRIFTATLAEAPPEDPVPVEVIELARDAKRPAGPRFGSLVHGILRDALNGHGELSAVARLHGRMVGATDEEIAAAAPLVEDALATPLLAGARGAKRLHAELPVKWKDGSTLLEGVIDLAFETASGWTVVDFKTDASDKLRPHYVVQAQWYAFALKRLTGKPVRAYLFRL
ncbi:MAG: UvrD-helicase domain-containing protein [Bryobacterales bacterium]|nr:UvrD-helicase domain-containing protein [Bryobacterales bacterium]